MNFNPTHYRALLIALLVTALTACNNEEIGSSSDVNPDRIYLDYHFTAYEEGGDIALKLQFRFGGPLGTTLVLDDPGGVMVDGVRVATDSSGIDGAFYELVRPFAEFAGPHEIVYLSPDGKKYQETIEFPVFRLGDVLPDTLSRDGLSLELAGLKKGDVIQVMLTDTAAYSRGIERIDSLDGGTISFTAAELEVLKPGPVNFQLIRHRSAPLKHPTPEGGKLTSTYSVSREVFIR